MGSQINLNLNRINNCPHGKPFGACPICSGGGVGGNSAKKTETPKINPGEMSWNECYAIGQSLKAAKERAELDKLAEKNYQQQDVLVTKTVPLSAEKIANLIHQFQNSPVSLIVNRVSNVITQSANTVFQSTIKFVNAVQTAFSRVTSVFTPLKEGFVNIMDKLTAIFGEQKNALKKFVSDNFKQLKKKIFSFFEEIDTSLEQGEDEKEDKLNLMRFFKFKKIKEKLNKYS